MKYVIIILAWFAMFAYWHYQEQTPEGIKQLEVWAAQRAWDKAHPSPRSGGHKRFIDITDCGRGGNY